MHLSHLMVQFDRLITSMLKECKKQCFSLYCCLSGPKFPPLFSGSLSAMCCNFIMYIFFLVRLREKGAKKSESSLFPTAKQVVAAGNCSWNRKNDYWYSPKVPSERPWRIHCTRRRQVIGLPTQSAQDLNQTRAGTSLMWERAIWRSFILFIVLPFPPSSDLFKTTKARRSHYLLSRCHWIINKSTWNFTEVKKNDSTPRSGSVVGFQYFWPPNCTIFGAPGVLPTYVCEPSTVCGKGLLSTLDTSVFKDWENMKWSSREEPPKLVTFHDDHSQPCNIDDLHWYQFASWKRPQFTPMTRPSRPWVLRTNIGTNTGHRPLRRESVS